MSRLLVGRARELSKLETAVRDVSSHRRGRVVLLAGEPGIGKSRLAEELGRLATAQGLTVVWGRAWEAGAAPAFWPWIQVSRALDLTVHLSGGSDGGGGPSPSVSAVGPDRFELFDTYARELARAAANRPLAVILEDIHAADQPSLLLFLFAAQQLRDQPVLFVGTYREAEARLSPERSSSIIEIGKLADVIRPSPLRREDVAHLINDALRGGGGGVAPASPSAEGALEEAAALVDVVHTATEGNPLFVDELLRLLETDGPEALAAGSIPDGVRAAIRRHVTLVSEECRQVLGVAAVIGREFSVPIVSAALSILAVGVSDPKATIAARLAEAMRAGLVVDLRHANQGQQQQQQQHRFTHVLVRDTLYDDLPHATRADVHRRVADVLVALHHDGDPSAPLADIARHYAEAGPEMASEAIDYAVRASRVARAQLAFEEAGPLLERALAALAALHTGSAPSDDAVSSSTAVVARRGELLVELAEARIHAGDGEGGRNACRQAASIARSIDSPSLLARAALAFGLQFTFGSVDRELTSLLEEALAKLGPTSTPARACLLARLAGALQPARDPTMPIARAREAIAVARDLGDASTLATVVVGAGSALQDIADPAERVPLNRELLEFALTRGDPTLALRAHLRLAFDFLEGGDPSAADAEMRAYERVAEGFRQERHHVLPAMWWAMRALVKGRFEEHARHLDEARRLAGSDPNVMRRLGCHLFLAARLRGEYELAAELASGARWFFDAIPASVASVEALLHADGGRDSEARAALSRVSAAEHIGGVLRVVRGLLAEAVWKSKDAELAEQILPAFEAFSERIGAWSMTAMFCDGPLARHVALVAVTAGNFDEAERHWARAEQLARADGQRPILVHLQLDRAESLLRRDVFSDTERERARAFAAEAREEAEALALPALVARAERLLGSAKRPPSRSGHPPPQLATSPAMDDAVAISLRCEGDYWTLSGRGESARLKSSRGLQMLAVLLEHAGSQIAAIELDATPGAIGGGGGPANGGVASGVIDVGDAGEILDEQARRAYKGRIRELDEELAEADRWNDTARAARIKRELEGLTTELTRAVGLGGRARRSGSPGERARINVQRRVTDAIRRIEVACPELGRHLSETVRTGTMCWYDPMSRKRPS